jgi:hypothetical protein
LNEGGGTVEFTRITDRLGDSGVTVRFGPVRHIGRQLGGLTATLTRGGSAQEYDVIHGPSVRLADATRAELADSERPLLIWTAFASSKTADSFRRAGIQFVDAAGNAWLQFGEVLIDIRGRSRTDDEPRPVHTSARNLFSAGRAQVVFALLAWPELWHATQRELARAAGVSVGLAHDALQLLKQTGYDWRANVPHQDGLLDHWAAAFPTGLAPRLALGQFRGEISEVKKVHGDDPIFVSGQSAAQDLVRPVTLTLYVAALDRHLPIINRWRSDGLPNIFVRQKFWQAPDQSDVPLAGVSNAPWPLVYADLATSEDPRLRDTARYWKDRFARPAP